MHGKLIVLQIKLLFQYTVKSAFWALLSRGIPGWKTNLVVCWEKNGFSLLSALPVNMISELNIITDLGSEVRMEINSCSYWSFTLCNYSLDTHNIMACLGSPAAARLSHKTQHCLQHAAFQQQFTFTHKPVLLWPEMQREILALTVSQDFANRSIGYGFIGSSCHQPSYIKKQ